MLLDVEGGGMLLGQRVEAEGHFLTTHFPLSLLGRERFRALDMVLLLQGGDRTYTGSTGPCFFD